MIISSTPHPGPVRDTLPLRDTMTIRPCLGTGVFFRVRGGVPKIGRATILMPPGSKHPAIEFLGVL